jgi:N-acetyl-anhydromuramyl-L-alanine amidase AmpD
LQPKTLDSKYVKGELNIDAQGMVTGNVRITPRRMPAIERTPLKQILGIVVHQTDTIDERAVYNSYNSPKANGAHFLIAKDGMIYQTASLSSRTNHAGKLKARCIAEHKCTPAELIKHKKTPSKDLPAVMNKMEMLKTVPSPYPSNLDSIGIEIVGKASLPPGKKMPSGLTALKQDIFIRQNAVYEPVNGQQQLALQYLIDELTSTLHIPKSEIHRHPEVSRKNPTEASTATWK